MKWSLGIEKIWPLAVFPLGSLSYPHLHPLPLGNCVSKQPGNPSLYNFIGKLKFHLKNLIGNKKFQILPFLMRCNSAFSDLWESTLSSAGKLDEVQSIWLPVCVFIIVIPGCKRPSSQSRTQHANTEPRTAPYANEFAIKIWYKGNW